MQFQIHKYIKCQSRIQLDKKDKPVNLSNELFF